MTSSGGGSPRSRGEGSPQLPDAQAAPPGATIAAGAEDAAARQPDGADHDVSALPAAPDAAASGGVVAEVSGASSSEAALADGAAMAEVDASGELGPKVRKRCRISKKRRLRIQRRLERLQDGSAPLGTDGDDDDASDASTRGGQDDEGEEAEVEADDTISVAVLRELRRVAERLRQRYAAAL
mmetsp:Transcript_76072/g.210422  ORF Transcript_76072/g.210422 Transcript_76072/m.210422 type:complete len:183 (-) Transcript_76072:103-651(-)